ncbi:MULTISPECIES: BadF/BadG/BcrA/BcrD ATPase family protein [unclassified Streptomyces]|uniref:N-acetylglucosamine kinase n=1 Tax=unclassified Streptomyces TaxID=2593676 RepID=UPI0006FDA012|nr:MULTISPECIES: BadF/BadG/BcrA/BcrD ATPase family protein [unclassified Streptomyces]KQX52896.1 ATPase [Streptomyces sp. Root1304]KRA89812.1 ATPase [Streptomyces sp. Root66D1]
MGVNPDGVLLAVDAGNSKTDVAVVAPDGTVLGAARGGGFQPPVVGVGTAVDSLAEIVGRACEEAGVPAGFAHVTACLANADLPVEETALQAEVLGRGWSGSVRVHNDTFAILRAGIDEPRGVAVVCGAGINCVGMAPDGRTARFPAIGKISGDWGGGSGMAEEALWFAARAEDGRGEPSELARALPAHFGLESMYALIEALHLGLVPFERRHELTPVLFRVSAAGDPVALSLVHRLAEEVVALSSVALGRLGLLGEEAPVMLGGSVLAARHPQLEERIRELLAERAPKAVIGFVTAPPVLGAGLLALDEVAAGPEAAARLREHYGA